MREFFPAQQNKIIKMKIAKTLLIGLTTLTGFLPFAQTTNDIIAKHVESIGGMERLANLNSIRMSGTMTAQGTDISVVTSKLHQVGVRMDLDITGSENYQLLNDKTGWIFFPVMGMTEPREMEAPVYKTSVHQLDVQGALVNYKEKGISVQLVGKEKVNGADAHKLKVIFKNGHSATYYIDEKTSHHVKTVSRSFLNGNDAEVEITFNDFKQNADGYWFPYSITNSQGTIIYDKIETNIALDPKLFSN